MGNHRAGPGRAQGRRGPGPAWRRPGCATPTSTSGSPATARALPIIGGHEGAGVVQEVGPGVTRLQGRRPRRLSLHPRLRRAAATARPATRTCATSAPTPPSACQITDGTVRHHARRRGPRPACACSARSPSTPCVNEARCIKIDDDIPLERGLPGRLRRDHRLGLGGLRRRRRARATPSSSSASAASASTPCRAPAAPAPSASSPSTRWSSSGRRRWSSAPRTRSPIGGGDPAIVELTWGQMADKVIMHGRRDGRRGGHAAVT